MHFFFHFTFFFSLLTILQSFELAWYYVTTTDGTFFEILVNPDDWSDAGTLNSEGYNEMMRHAQALSRIPYVFRKWLKWLILNGYGKGSRAGANSDFKAISANAGYTDPLFERGTMEEFFVHEGCHGQVDPMYRVLEFLIAVFRQNLKVIETDLNTLFVSSRQR